MLVKAKDGTFKENVGLNENSSGKLIALEDTFIIQTFFNEEFFGVFDRDTFSFVNTNIKLAK